VDALRQPIAERLRRAGQRLAPAAFIVAVGALFALLPFPTCPVRRVLGVPCPGCGLTRAALAALHLDFASACGYHPLVLPLIALAIGMTALAFSAREEAWRRGVTLVVGGASVALVGVWALRFLGFFGGPVR
jgi:hypothetical protein